MVRKGSGSNKKSVFQKYIGGKIIDYFFLQTWGVINQINVIIRGIVSYYSGSGSKAMIYSFLYLFKKSSALTLAYKV